MWMYSKGTARSRIALKWARSMAFSLRDQPFLLPYNPSILPRCLTTAVQLFVVASHLRTRQKWCYSQNRS